MALKIKEVVPNDEVRTTSDKSASVDSLGWKIW